MNGQFDRTEQTHLRKWEDIGYWCRIMLRAGRVEIRIWPFAQAQESKPIIQGGALPGQALRFYPLPEEARDSAGYQAVRRSLEALTSLRGVVPASEIFLSDSEDVFHA